jgi:DNA-3-methyladenine glycosylase I
MRASRCTRSQVTRCSWAGSDPLYIAYHDFEWGTPTHDDRKLFEFLILEGFQAGLSWLTILRKRENFRAAFADWNWNRVAAFSARDVRRLLADAGIVRNRLKVSAAIANAKAFIKVREELGSFDRYLWSFTKGRTLRAKRRARALNRIPTHSAESDALSKDLRSRGFSFVGTTICYSFMQAMGVVDDHMAGCFRCRPRVRT